MDFLSQVHWSYEKQYPNGIKMKDWVLILSKLWLEQGPKN